jgi:hypothetical protein
MLLRRSEQPSRGAATRAGVCTSTLVAAVKDFVPGSGGGSRFHRGHIYDELMRSLAAMVAERSASAMPGTMRSDMP